MPPPPVHRSLLLVLALFLLRTTIAQLVVVSTYSSNACAPGGVPITTTLACQTAATTLNIGYKDEIEDDEEPKGCGWYCTNAQLNANNGLCGLYFNTHSSGAPRYTTRTVCHDVRPGPPQSVAVRVIDEDTLQVTIAPPLNDGGANITHYEFYLAAEHEAFGYSDTVMLPFAFASCGTRAEQIATAKIRLNNACGPFDGGEQMNTRPVVEGVDCQQKLWLDAGCTTVRARQSAYSTWQTTQTVSSFSDDSNVWAGTGGSDYRVKACQTEV